MNLKVYLRRKVASEVIEANFIFSWRTAPRFRLFMRLNYLFLYNFQGVATDFLQGFFEAWCFTYSSSHANHKIGMLFNTKLMANAKINCFSDFFHYRLHFNHQCQTQSDAHKTNNLFSIFFLSVFSFQVRKSIQIHYDS